jgi:antitoxin component YwqK of YwqJK toxin-antitoxin module
MWAADGSVVEEANYVKGKMEGRFFQKLPDGRETVSYYQNNLKHGTHEVFFPLNQFKEKIKAMETTYENDLIHGLLVEYNERGLKLVETPYCQGKKSGESKIYSADGKVQMIIPFKDNLQEGQMVQYFSDGAVYRTTPFVSGKKEGEEKTFHEDGSLASIFPYENDQLQGLSQSWNTAGILVFEAEYEKGKRHGYFKKYYEDGSPYLVEHFVFDALDGQKMKYGRKGEQSISHYKAGQLQ